MQSTQLPSPELYMALQAENHQLKLQNSHLLQEIVTANKFWAEFYRRMEGGKQLDGWPRWYNKAPKSNHNTFILDGYITDSARELIPAVSRWNTQLKGINLKHYTDDPTDYYASEREDLSFQRLEQMVSDVLLILYAARDSNGDKLFNELTTLLHRVNNQSLLFLQEMTVDHVKWTLIGKNQWLNKGTVKTMITVLRSISEAYNTEKSKEHLSHLAVEELDAWYPAKAKQLWDRVIKGHKPFVIPDSTIEPIRELLHKVAEWSARLEGKHIAAWTHSLTDYYRAERLGKDSTKFKELDKIVRFVIILMYIVVKHKGQRLFNDIDNLIDKYKETTPSHMLERLYQLTTTYTGKEGDMKPDDITQLISLLNRVLDAYTVEKQK